MRAMLNGWRWLRSIGRRGELERGLDAEIRFHVEQQTEKLIGAGLPPDEARRRAVLRFGGMEPTKDAVRDEFRPLHLERLAREVRFARRALLRAPGFTAAAVLTLALGIGATTAMFSIVDGVLLRPLPYPDSDRLVELVHTAPQFSRLYASPAIYFGYRDFGQVFESVGHWDADGSPITVTGRGEPESVPSLAVTHEVLPTLGATPTVGRSFRASDDEPGAAPTAILSFGYAQRRFGGADPVGQTLIVAGVPRQIIGVLPRSFRFFGDDVDIYYPLQPDRTGARFPSFDGRAFARLKPGVTLEQANADAVRLMPVLAREFGGSTAGASRPMLQITPRLHPLKDSVVGDVGNTLWLLLGTIALLLVLACANVANLMLVRSETRRPELVIRAALGAGGAAIASVVLLESLMVGVAGGLAGLGVAYASLPLLIAVGGDDLPGVMAIGIERRVLLVTVATTLVTSVLFALAPLAHVAVSRLQLARSLHAGGRGSLGRHDIARARHALVVAQVAVALVLLVGTGLMIRTFVTLRQVDPGISDPDKVLTFQLTLPAATPVTGETPDMVRERFLLAHRAIAERLAAVAGVDAIGFGGGNDPLPLDGDGRSISFLPYFDGQPVGDGVARVWESGSVSPGFFEALGTSVIAGRPLNWDDIERSRPAAMVSENLARREWGSPAAALGHRVAAVPTQEPFEIVGVLEDVRYDGMDQAAPEVLAQPVRGGDIATYAVRSPRVGTTAFIDDIREAVWSVNPNLSLASVRTMGVLYDRSMARRSITLSLLAMTGLIAFALGLIGVYGVVAYAMSLRRREIGLRMALGARHQDVRRMFVKHALVPVGIGITVGLGSASLLTRAMTSQLFGVTPLDPVTHITVALALVMAAAAASYISAWRGSSLDPAAVLRAE